MLKVPCESSFAPKQTGSIFIFFQFSEINFDVIWIQLVKSITFYSALAKNRLVQCRGLKKWRKGKKIGKEDDEDLWLGWSWMELFPTFITLWYFLLMLSRVKQKVIFSVHGSFLSCPHPRLKHCDWGWLAQTQHKERIHYQHNSHRAQLSLICIPAIPSVESEYNGP